MEIFIGQNIKYLCAENNLRQVDFSELFEVKQSTLAGYIANRTEPTYAFSIRVCRHFKISLDDFITKDMSKGEYQPTSGHLPLAMEPAAEYKSQDKIIMAQEKLIASLEKQIERLENERDNGNLGTGAKVS